MGLVRGYRATGADLPYGDPLRSHGVAMEGYFWRFTDPVSRRVLVALIGVNARGGRHWATAAVAASATADEPAYLRAVELPDAWADPMALGVRAGSAFLGTGRRVLVDLGGSCRLDVTVDEPVPWPRRAFGGSSGFHIVPALNQYWHPWLLGGTARGTAVLDGRRWVLDGAATYAEKNWGREGFPEAWWWGQAHGFPEPEACVAFAGGQVTAGPVHTEVTALVVRLPSGAVVRLGNPGLSPVAATVTDSSWRLRGRSALWQVDVDAAAVPGDAHVLPVPLPREGRNTPGAIEHLSGSLVVTVRRGGRTVWSGESALAGLEHGGLAGADAELRRRGAPPHATSALPVARPVGRDGLRPAATPQ